MHGNEKQGNCEDDEDCSEKRALVNADPPAENKRNERTRQVAYMYLFGKSWIISIPE